MNIQMVTDIIHLCLEYHPDEAYVMTKYMGLMMEIGASQNTEIILRPGAPVQNNQRTGSGLAGSGNLFHLNCRNYSVGGFPVYQEVQNLCRELSNSLGVDKKRNG